MRLNQLAQEIEAWKGDETLFLRGGRRGLAAVSRSGVRERILRAVDSISTRTRARASVGLSFGKPESWVVGLLATRLAGRIAVPIPSEFSSTQIRSFAPGLDAIIKDSAPGVKEDDFLLQSGSGAPQGPCLPPDAVAVIHTSGSTSEPKGVVISEQGLDLVIGSMSERLSGVGPLHYVSVLPMSLLLEQILGVYLPINTQGSLHVLPDDVAAYSGTQTSLLPYLDTIRGSSANFTMIPPSFLYDLKRHLERGRRGDPRTELGATLRVIATGGAPIDLDCLEYFRDRGVEIHQGYGLSENTSVVAWTYPGPNRLGSVGKPLSHVEVRIADGEQVEIRGESLFLGYVEKGEFKARTGGSGAWLRTGDTGALDEHGELRITGRDANLLVLSSGRNVAPEWIEGRFAAVSGVKEVLAIGHGKPFVSLLAFMNEGAQPEAVVNCAKGRALEIARELPEFARIREIRALPFEKRHYSVSGRILRARAISDAADVIRDIYKDR